MENFRSADTINPSYHGITIPWYGPTPYIRKSPHDMVPSKSFLTNSHENLFSFSEQRRPESTMLRFVRQNLPLQSSIFLTAGAIIADFLCVSRE